MIPLPCPVFLQLYRIMRAAMLPVDKIIALLKYI